MKEECHDPASIARVSRLEQTCRSQYAAAEAKRKEDRRAIRARYVKEVSGMLLDPEYAPAADRYRALAAEAFGRHDRQLNRAVEAALVSLAAIAERHHIDPSYAKELELW